MIEGVVSVDDTVQLLQALFEHHQKAEDEETNNAKAEDKDNNTNNNKKDVVVGKDNGPLRSALELSIANTLWLWGTQVYMKIISHLQKMCYMLTMFSLGI